MLYDLTLLSVTNVRQLVVLLCMYRGFFSKKKLLFRVNSSVYTICTVVYLLSLGEDLFSRKNRTADTFGQDWYKLSYAYVSLFQIQSKPTTAWRRDMQLTKSKWIWKSFHISRPVLYTTKMRFQNWFFFCIKTFYKFKANSAWRGKCVCSWQNG